MYSIKVYLVFFYIFNCYSKYYKNLFLRQISQKPFIKLVFIFIFKGQKYFLKALLLVKLKIILNK